MKNSLRKKVVVIATLVCAGSGLTGCGPDIKGTYSDGGSVILEVRSGGAATMTFMGESAPCTYVVSGSQLNLDCKGEAGKLTLTIHDDGSLVGPPGTFVPPLRKTKS
jgi:hypothetical protein